MNPETDRQFLRQAIDLAARGSHADKGGPFGCIVVKDGLIVGSGYNEVTSSNDPTAHAEVVAIRKACRQLGSFQLTGCTLYTSCEPCPMCLGAIYWARPDRVVFACTREDAARAGFDDAFIYDELNREPSERKIIMNRMQVPEAEQVFRNWMDKENKTRY